MNEICPICKKKITKDDQILFADKKNLWNVRKLHIECYEKEMGIKQIEVI